MATIRERRPGVWEVRVFTGADARGRPTQMSRTVRGGKRDAQKLAAQLETNAGDAKPAGRLVADVLDEWVKQNLDTWAPSSARDQQSRVRSIKKDPIARLSLSRLSVGDVERWHTASAGGGNGRPRDQEPARCAARRAVAGRAVGVGVDERRVDGPSPFDEGAAA